MGIPAYKRSSMSRLIVLLDTSNISASSGAVTFSFCSRTDSIPISLSVFIFFPLCSDLNKTNTTTVCHVYSITIIYFVRPCQDKRLFHYIHLISIISSQGLKTQLRQHFITLFDRVSTKTRYYEQICRFFLVLSPYTPPCR